jgi:hypothetical protein
MVLCLAALVAFSGCQSGSPLDLNDEAPQNTSSTDDDVDLIGEAYSASILDEPVLPKGPSDLELEEIGDLEIGLLDTLFLSMHIPLAEGDNDVPVEDYLAASDNVSDMALPGSPGWHLDEHGNLVFGMETIHFTRLSSGPGEVSFVTYGFSDIPEGKEIIGVRINGFSEAELFNPGEGLYVGMGDYYKDAWRWYGPYGTQSEYDITFRNLDSTNDGQRGYLTLAVYGGDTYTIESIEVVVGDKLPLLLIKEEMVQASF